MSAAMEAIAFRVWQFCNSREWTCTVKEIEEGTGIPERKITGVIGWKKWGGRLPYTSPQWSEMTNYQRSFRSMERAMVLELVGRRMEGAE